MNTFGTYLQASKSVYSFSDMQQTKLSSKKNACVKHIKQPMKM